MKPIVILSIITAMFAVVYPIVTCINDPIVSSSQSHEQSISLEEANSIKNDTEITVNVLVGGKNVPMKMNDYLIGVVSAEMPVSFEAEALKAQAVAARTYTLYNMQVSKNPNHPGSDVCTDHRCCKAYADDNTLKSEWGESYNSNIEKIRNAVYSTDGEYISYENSPILAVFHSSSASMTESCENVWSSKIPYLISVYSPENEDQPDGFETTVSIAHKEFVDTVLEIYPNAYFGDDISIWIRDAVYNDSGRIDHITVGDTVISGVVIRDMFELRSTCFTVEMKSESVVFHVKGYGHGVGMSQYGANELAKRGYGYKEIIKWYYTGVIIEKAP